MPELSEVSEVDAARRALYQAPFEAFVATRDRLVAERKAAGDKAGASALGKCKRPAISAWAVNQLWWQAHGAFAALLATAARLRRGELAATAPHREATAKLRATASELLGAGGHGANEATLRRVMTTVAAIAATGGFAPDADGELVADRDPPGFEALAALGADAADAADTAVPVTPVIDIKEARAAAEKRAAEKAATEKAAADKAAAEKKAATDKAAVEKAALDKRLADQRAAEERAATQLAAEQAAVEKRATRQRVERELAIARNRVVAARKASDAARATLAGAEVELATARSAVAALEALLD